VHPILIQIGPFAIRYYGLMYVIGTLVGIYLLRRECRRLNLPLSEDSQVNLVLLLVFLGILGGRIYYVIFNWDYYSRNPLEIPAIWHGGLAIHGGLIAGVLAGLWFVRRHGLPFLKLADVFVPMIALAQAFGRFGNFMNGDAHGVPTYLPWGIVFPPDSIAGRQFGSVPLHPTMLYELVWDLANFWVLWRLRRTPRKRGFQVNLYLIFYSVGRGVIESFRADSLMLGSWRVAQLVSAFVVLASTAWLFGARLWKPAP